MMPTLHLTQIQFTQLQPMIWCATAQVSEYPRLTYRDLWGQSPRRPIDDASYSYTDECYKCNWQYHLSSDDLSTRDIARAQRQRQRQGVRLLLQQLLNKLALSDTLNESDFPYRLIKGGHYVCFSHTGGKSKSKLNKNDNQVINTLLSSTVAVVISLHRPIGIDVELNNVAWHVAQRFYSDNEIAILHSLPTTQRDTIAKLLWQIKESFIKIHQYKLAQGLGIDYSSLIDDLIDASREPSALTIITDHKSPYQIAILSMQQTVVVF
ncbi:4'-phosphopantetheinyl transferase superfamily protein [Psychrobacter sp. NZS113]|uniref:4'-phosphopantetheinyl transferase family protein n=1 Tax=Psychrobacter sp. NZS113 TaxID=2792045 RepID=UPI0018CD0A1F|nr:4'-phosphopantetheinyl transferase superfamily protein [Psychrobacter sp. NZS113]MBH0095689.1 4'-phosphopantetheinyl transferase superfamily protein [Psychrobacter sp. NZS113]